MSDKKITIQLHPFELWLVNKWRKKYRYGEITVSISDGIPVRIVRAFANETPQNDLDNNQHGNRNKTDNDQP